MTKQRTTMYLLLPPKGTKVVLEENQRSAGM